MLICVYYFCLFICLSRNLSWCECRSDLSDVDSSIFNSHISHCLSSLLWLISINQWLGCTLKLDANIARIRQPLIFLGNNLYVGVVRKQFSNIKNQHLTMLLVKGFWQILCFPCLHPFFCKSHSAVVTRVSGHQCLGLEQRLTLAESVVSIIVSLIINLNDTLQSLATTISLKVSLFTSDLIQGVQ